MKNNLITGKIYKVIGTNITGMIVSYDELEDKVLLLVDNNIEMIIKGDEHRSTSDIIKGVR